MAYAIATSKIIPGIEDSAAIVFGTPPLMRIFLYLFHPYADPSSLLLNPVGRAAWMGLFATALNLLPIWQLDGGHIVFSLWDRYHQRISLVLAAITLAMGTLSPVWYLWGGMLFILCLRFRHPPLLDPWEPLGASRKLWAVAALVIFLSVLYSVASPLGAAPFPYWKMVQLRLAGSTSTITAVSGISFAAQKSRQPDSTFPITDRCGDFSTNWNL